MDNRGYALVTVIAISLILNLIGMTILYLTKSRLEAMSSLADLNEARLKKYSMSNFVIFNILTSRHEPLGITFGEQGNVSHWNLYGEDIHPDDYTTVRITDCSALVSPLLQPRILARVLESLGEWSKGDIAHFVDELADWQDPDDLKRLNGAESFQYVAVGFPYTPRNGPIQTLDEIFLLKDFKRESFNILLSNLTYWTPGPLNPLLMSEQLLEAFLGNKKLAREIVRLRERSELTRSAFLELTGIPEESESLSFTPSGCFKVEIIVELERAKDRVEFVIERKESDIAPMRVLEWRE